MRAEVDRDLASVAAATKEQVQALVGEDDSRPWIVTAADVFRATGVGWPMNMRGAICGLARVLVLCAGCRDARVDCAQLPSTRIRSTHPLEAIERCRERFAPACSAALARVTTSMTEADSTAIFAACVAAYPSLDPRLASSHSEWFAAALEASRDLDAPSQSAIGMMIAADLAPKPLVVRLHADAIELEHAGTWPMSQTPDLDAAMTALLAHGAKQRGVVFWGQEDAPETARAFQLALQRAGIDLVVRCLRDRSNCPD